MNVWERIKNFIGKIKGNKKEQLALDEKNEVKEIIEKNDQENNPDYEEMKQQYVKNVGEDSNLTIYVTNINGWVENSLQQELRNISFKTILPSTKGELIEKHEKTVKELIVGAIGAQIGFDPDKYVQVVPDAKERCTKRIINPNLKNVISKVKEWLKANDIDQKDVTEEQLKLAFKSALMETKFVQDVTEKAVQLVDKGLVTFDIGDFGNVVGIKFSAFEKLDLCYDDKAFSRKDTTIQVTSGQSNTIEKVMTVVHKVTYGVPQAVLELKETVDIRDEDGSFLSNVCTTTCRKLESGENPEWIMQKYEKGIYKMDIADADYYTRDILAKKDGDIVWKKITTKPGHENECKVVIYPDGDIGADEIKKENITADEVEGAWSALKKCVGQDALPIAE
ncbi:MAG: hypothetical protein IKE91_04345 [Clostridia bacterium]|nr:hypothetical protein [Clostridia bacterium]